MSDLRAKSASIEKDGNVLMLHVRLVGGSRLAFPLSRIKSFTPARIRVAGSALYAVKVEDRGASISWPDLDIDFSVVEMLPKYLGITTARESARRAGSVASPAKAVAARANGAKGGRPRKKVA
jgi:hypothetical protein